ncbi:hypothetical protein V6B16_08430 [Salinimicrobium catena]|uniref:cytidylyltransferase domain-containing protein n=1 Tax=Salinimicrobium catena TaxID=390640 RepID=UPI002FE482BA
MKNIIVIIPARGGSKGIARKNLRLLAGKPLISYSIETALNSTYSPDVYVTTEDDEIELIAQKFGAKIHKRPAPLADDKSTLDPVIYTALEFSEKVENKKYDIVITMQPTSPLLAVNSIDAALKSFINSDRETIISAQDDTHLTWRKEGLNFFPNYKERLNRQYLEPVYKETGGFLITRRDIITEKNRIGKNVDLFLLKGGEEIDIDTYNDWNLCEYLLQKKKILFVVGGNEIIGMGHVYNTLIVANDILNHEVQFLVPKGNLLAFEKISSKNYKVQIQSSENILDDIENINPDIIINDILDTDEEYIKAIKKRNITCINFEDLGEGAKQADLVINAIYPEREEHENHYYGEQYFILRDEFIFNYSNKTIKEEVNEVLITFGGVDPCNLTEFTLDSIYDFCVNHKIKINIVTGPGYTKYETLDRYKEATVFENVQNISDFMFSADIVFTSAGRTIYEVASIGVPAIVLAQNERELTHFFAAQENGFINLGLGTDVSRKELLDQFKILVNTPGSRIRNHELMINQNLKLGRKKVLSLINNLIQNRHENNRVVQHL